MKRKKIYIFLSILIFFQISLFANKNEIEKILQNESITLGLGFDEQSRSIAGVIYFNKGQVSSFGNGTFSIILNPNYRITDNYLEIYYSKCTVKNFLDVNKSYNVWLFPERLKVNVTIEDLLKACNSRNHFTRVIIDTSQTYPTTCQAIVIDNLNIRSEPSLNGKKIGKLKKCSEVTLYDKSENIDEIDGEKYYWYKVKVRENEYGWVFGGYVRIFFDDESLGYSDKEKILDSLKD